LAKEDLITLAEAVALSGLSKSHLRLLASRGAIDAQKVGRDWLTTRRAVLAYVRDVKKRSKDPWKRKR